MLILKDFSSDFSDESGEGGIVLKENGGVFVNRFEATICLQALLDKSSSLSELSVSSIMNCR